MYKAKISLFTWGCFLPPHTLEHRAVQELACSSTSQSGTWVWEVQQEHAVAALEDSH